MRDRVGSQQLIDALTRVHPQLKQRLDLAVVAGVQARLDALQHREEALVPRGIRERVGELDEPVDPLRVGHGFNVAEERLRGLRQGLDDLVAALVVLLDGQARDQPRRARERVVEVVDVGEQVALRRRHAVAPGAARNPAAVLIRGKSLGVDQQVLDGVGGLGLLGGHGDGSNKHSVDRHERQVPARRPVTGDEIGGALGGVDASADGEIGVVVLTHLAVGLDENVVKVHPGVVSSGVAVFDHEDDGHVGVGFGDLQHRADLCGRTRFEGDVGEAVGTQLSKKVCGLLDLGDAGRDADPVERCARGAGFGHHAGLTELEVPQEAVEEHGVELGGAPRL